MDNKPKSFWTKAWRGRWSTLLWIGLVACSAIAVVYVVALACGMAQGTGFVSIALIAGGALMVIATLVVMFIRWVSCWRNFRRFLLGLACVITFIALAYLEENLRGKSAWNNFQREWGAKGEKFDWASF